MSKQLALELERPDRSSVKPKTESGLGRPVRSALYQGYDVTDTDADIKRWFKLRYGTLPTQIIREKSITLAGPIPQGQTRGSAPTGSTPTGSAPTASAPTASALTASASTTAKVRANPRVRPNQS